VSGLVRALSDSLSRVTEQAVSSAARQVRVGLLGCGNVGGALVPLLRAQRDAIAARTGLELVVTTVAVRNMSRDRGVDLGDVELTNDAMAVVSDPGAELFELADSNGVDLLFEAAVAGGIPLIRPLRESLRGEPVSRVMGILNGTTNYILSKMTNEGADYADALSEAQRLGYAERDPTADVEGFDAGAKAAIIASIAFGVKVVAGDVYHEGISNITASDIAIAGRLGYVVKLLGIAEQDRETGEVAVRVHPVMVPNEHPLASVRDSYNAVFVEGDAVGSLMFYGRGAGGSPTASAVLGDLIDAAVNRSQGTHGSLGAFQRARVRPIDATSAEYLLALDVLDQPGVLHSVTGVFAQHGVSIRAAEQEGAGEEARLVFITHEAVESSVQATVRQLRELDVVRRIGGLIRVIGA
jgi:homoserine dehydrogenase